MKVCDGYFQGAEAHLDSGDRCRPLFLSVHPRPFFSEVKQPPGLQTSVLRMHVPEHDASRRQHIYARGNV